jgi:hypothetical protein
MTFCEIINREAILLARLYLQAPGLSHHALQEQGF